MDKMKLAIYAAFVMNEDVTQGEAARASGYSNKNGFAKMDNHGKLPADRIIAACEVWGINATDALIIMGYMEPPTPDWEPTGMGDPAVAARTRTANALRRKGQINHELPV